MVKQGKAKSKSEARKKFEAIKRTYFKGSTGTTVSKEGKVYAVGTGGGSAPVSSGGTPATSGGKPVIVDNEAITREQLEAQRKEREKAQQIEQAKRTQIEEINRLYQLKRDEQIARRGKRGEIITTGPEEKYTDITATSYTLTPRSAVVRPEFVKSRAIVLSNLPEQRKPKQPGVVESRGLKTGAELYAEAREKKLSDYEERVLGLKKREEAFYGSEGFKRISGLASYTTEQLSRYSLVGLGIILPKKEPTPLEQRGEVGYIVESGLRSAFSFPIALGGAVPITFQKAYLYGEARAMPETRELALRERKRARAEVGRITSPTTKEGRATLIQAGAFALLDTATQLAQGTSPFSKVEVRTATRTAPPVKSTVSKTAPTGKVSSIKNIKVTNEVRSVSFKQGKVTDVTYKTGVLKYGGKVRGQIKVPGETTRTVIIRKEGPLIQTKPRAKVLEREIGGRSPSISITEGTIKTGAKTGKLTLVGKGRKVSGSLRTKTRDIVISKTSKGNLKLKSYLKDEASVTSPELAGTKIIKSAKQEPFIAQLSKGKLKTTSQLDIGTQQGGAELYPTRSTQRSTLYSLRASKNEFVGGRDFKLAVKGEAKGTLRQIDLATQQTEIYTQGKSIYIAKRPATIEYARQPTYKPDIVTAGITTGAKGQPVEPFRYVIKRPQLVTTRETGFQSLVETSFSVSGPRPFKSFGLALQEGLKGTFGNKKGVIPLSKTKLTPVTVQTQTPVKPAVRSLQGPPLTKTEVLALAYEIQGPGSKVFGAPILIEKPAIKTEILTPTRIEIAPRTETPTITRTYTPTKAITKTPTITETKTPTITITETPTRTITRTRTETKTDTETITKTPTKTETPFVPPPSFPPVNTPPARPPFLPPAFGFKPRESIVQESYTVEVRRRGVFQDIGTETTKERAFFKGALIVGTTASASLRVTKGGSPIFGGQYLNPRQFYKSRKEPGVFIERREKRIKSPGELAEITFKGIATQKQRRARGFSVFGG